MCIYIEREIDIDIDIDIIYIDANIKNQTGF